jgi:hypothetical protein
MTAGIHDGSRIWRRSNDFAGFGKFSTFPQKLTARRRSRGSEHFAEWSMPQASEPVSLPLPIAGFTPMSRGRHSRWLTERPC